MNARFLLIGAALFVAATAGARQGSDIIIKQRAKELRDQNNVQQGVATPAPPVPTAAPAASTPARPLTPQEQNLARLRADLMAIKPDAPATQLRKQQLARDFIAVSQGPAKPSQPAANKLAEDVASALSEKLLAQVTRDRLLQDLNAVLNPAKVSSGQLQDILADIQAIFQANNLERKAAVAIADDAKAIASETQKTAVK